MTDNRLKREILKNIPVDMLIEHVSDKILLIPLSMLDKMERKRNKNRFRR